MKVGIFLLKKTSNYIKPRLLLFLATFFYKKGKEFLSVPNEADEGEAGGGRGVAGVQAGVRGQGQPLTEFWPPVGRQSVTVQSRTSQ